MALSILNDISALAAQNQLSITQTNLAKALTQLSSGSRINSGADDAAGLSIANGLQANIVALTQSVQNAATSTGLLQTADGALAQVSSLLNRAVTLATEASSDGFTAAQASSMDSEFQSILREINQIGSASNFNGMPVFSDTAMTPFLSDGIHNLLSGTSMSVGSLTTGGLGIGTTGTGGANATNTLTLTSNVTEGSTVQIGTTTYTFQVAAASSAGQVQIGNSIAATLQNLAAAVNGTDGVNIPSNTAATASVSGSSITFAAKTSGAGGNGVTATGTLTAAGGSAGTWSSAGSAGELGGGSNGSASSAQLWMVGSPHDGDRISIGGTTYTFKSTLDNNPDEVLIAGGFGNMDTLSNLAEAIMGDPGRAGVDYSSATANTNVAYWFISPDCINLKATVNGPDTSEFGTITSSSNISWATAPGTLGTSATGSLTLTSNLVAGSTATVGDTTYTFVSGASSGTNVHIDTTAAATLANLASAINGNASDTKVQASASGNTLALTAATAGSAGNSLAASGNLIAAGGSAGTWSNGGVLTGGVDQVAPSSDLNSTAHAQAALAAVTRAINTVAQRRGTVGAYINQLHAASSVATTQVANLTTAESAISDADMATTVADMAKFSILQSTGMAALAQASDAQKAVLKLLQ